MTCVLPAGARIEARLGAATQPGGRCRWLVGNQNTTIQEGSEMVIGAVPGILQWALQRSGSRVIGLPRPW